MTKDSPFIDSFVHVAIATIPPHQWRNQGISGWALHPPRRALGGIFLQNWLLKLFCKIVEIVYKIRGKLKIRGNFLKIRDFCLQNKVQ